MRKVRNFSDNWQVLPATGAARDTPARPAGDTLRYAEPFQQAVARIRLCTAAGCHEDRSAAPAVQRRVRTARASAYAQAPLPRIRFPYRSATLRGRHRAKARGSYGAPAGAAHLLKALTHQGTGFHPRAADTSLRWRSARSLRSDACQTRRGARGPLRREDPKGAAKGRRRAE